MQVVYLQQAKGSTLNFRISKLSKGSSTSEIEAASVVGTQGNEGETGKRVNNGISAKGAMVEGTKKKM